MNSLTFGLTMLLIGMGGTMVTLGLLVLVIRCLTALFPPEDASGPSKRP